MTLEGIDVASYQGYINWEAVKHAGKSFAICKATEGVYYQDPTFAHNWTSTKYRGLIRGSYHFLRPEYDGAVQADYHHAYVRANGHFEVGDFCMIDLEVTDGRSAMQVITCAERFANRILTTTNCGVFLYTYPDFWNNQLGAPESTTLGRCPLVVASYGAPAPVLSNWPSGPAIWQYSESGQVVGIVGNCDLDRFLGTVQELHLLAREGGRH
jgi:lysozyme